MNVELRNIHKHFGKVHANDDITLIIKAGTIQGILGENGAGKSTLMKILSGFYQMDSGSILLDGKKVIIASPADAVKLGIGMLHQDPSDFPPMRVIDNIIVGSPAGIFPDKKKVEKEFGELQKQFGFSISPNAYVENLTVGERQQLEILRLLWLGAKVLILDEPTTGISAAQKERLFDTVRKLAKQGKSIIFVSHKLEEVETLCHQVAVFRQGKNVGEVKPPYKTYKLVEMMFGRVVKKSAKTCELQNDLMVKIENLEIDAIKFKIRDVNFDIRKGEVIGLAGMEGSGQGLILRALAGIIRPSGGRIFLQDGSVKCKNLVGRHYFDFKEFWYYFPSGVTSGRGINPGINSYRTFCPC